MLDVTQALAVYASAAATIQCGFPMGIALLSGFAHIGARNPGIRADKAFGYTNFRHLIYVI